MKKIFLIMISVFIVSCTTVHQHYRTAVNKYGKFNHEQDYLESEKYTAERVSVPSELSDTRFEDKFTVPLRSTKSNGSVPSEVPPVQSTKG